MLKPLGLAAATVFACALVMEAAPVAQTDLDAFMQKVLARRDENWKKLQQYILDERETIALRGPGRIPIWGQRREYSWFIKEGFFIRSPLKIDDVEVSEADRRKFEDQYLKRAQERDKQRAERDRRAASGEAERPEPEPSMKDFDSFLRQSRQPEFIESAYFLRFKFEQGKYAFVGREKLLGHDVLQIEYYPARLFSQEQDRQNRRRDAGQSNRDKDIEAHLEKMMNKVSLVTIWVEPAAHQIVKYTFDNVNFDFLPVAWLVRVSDLKASMTMSEAFKDVWLPRDVDMYFAAMLAVGAFDVHYHLDYYDYRQASTSGRIKAPGARP